MSDLFIPGQTVGIVGGGHKGRLLALTAKSMGFKVSILDPDKDCAASNVADWHILSKTTDESGLLSLAEKSDIITFACNSVNLNAMKSIGNVVVIPQKHELLELSQNRLLTKKYFEETNINITPYELIGESADLDLAIDAIGLPAIIKPVTQKLGKKQSFVIKSIEDIRHSIELLASGPCLLEAMLDYRMAVAVSVVGNGTGEYKVLPISEITSDPTGTYHRSVTPARLETEVMTEVNRIAEEIALSFKVRGLITIEMFITEYGVIYVNSLNHGPHDSADYTLDLGPVSQYQAHLRGIFGWPVPKYELTSEAVSILVQKNKLVDCLSMIPFKENWFYYFDGTSQRLENEVIGHITVVAEDSKMALKDIEKTLIWDGIFPFEGGNIND